MFETHKLCEKNPYCIWMLISYATDLFHIVVRVVVAGQRVGIKGRLDGRALVRRSSVLSTRRVSTSSRLPSYCPRCSPRSTSEDGSRFQLDPAHPCASSAWGPGRRWARRGWGGRRTRWRLATAMTDFFSLISCCSSAVKTNGAVLLTTMLRWAGVDRGGSPRSSASTVRWNVRRSMSDSSRLT